MERFKEWNKESSFINRFLFPAPRSSYSWSNFHGELIAVCHGSGGNESIFPCLLMPGVRPKLEHNAPEEDEPATAVFIYCHANGEDVGLCYEAGHWLSENLGVHVVIPEYPGYGTAPGRPNEISVYNNVKAAYDMIVHGQGFSPKRVIMFGRSIGTGPAIKLASELDVGGLVLVSPFTSVRDIVNDHVGFLASMLVDGLTHIFPSKEFIALAECPTLIVHGSLDKVIPVSQSRNLAKESGAICKQIVVLEGIGHHGIDLHIAVVNEAPRMFSLDGDPKDMNIDPQLTNPAMTNRRILSSVPAWDCLTGRWCRSSLPLGEPPRIAKNWVYTWNSEISSSRSPASSPAASRRGGLEAAQGGLDGWLTGRSSSGEGKEEEDAAVAEREQFQRALDEGGTQNQVEGHRERKTTYTPRLPNMGRAQDGVDGPGRGSGGGGRLEGPEPSTTCTDEVYLH